MTLLTPSPTDLAIRQIEMAESSAACAISSAIVALNNTHAAFWGQPDVVLAAILQRMLNEGTLQPTFAKHFETATCLNRCAELAGLPDRAVTVAGRAFSIGEDGLVVLRSGEGPPD